MANELKPCPFCGGKGRVSFKDKYWGGWNGRGDHQKAYGVQIICNKCHSRGKPITTDWLKNPNPYLTIYSGRYTEADLENPVIKNATEMFKPYVEQAIEAWNRRAEDGK